MKTLWLAPALLEISSPLETNSTWLYILLIIAIGFAILMALLAWRYYQLYCGIQREIAERNQAQARLHVSSRRYQVLVENAPFPIVISHLRHDKLLYLNPSAAHKFEIVRKFAVGKPIRELFVNPDDWNVLAKQFAERGYLQNVELRLKGVAGAIFWASLSATAMTFEDQPAIFLALIDISERKSLEVQLQEMALTDSLTNLFNRRYFTQKGEEEFVRAQRYHEPFSLIMLDVDKFKMVNDTFGHDAGDQVLRQLALAFRQSARNVDTLCRLGGEEFGLILPNTARESAIVVAERLRRAVECEQITLNNKTITVTISVGVAAFHDKMTTLDDLLRDADTALYRAKANGRNQVIIG